MLDPLTAFRDIARKFKIELCRQVIGLVPDMFAVSNNVKDFWQKTEREVRGLSQVPLFKVFLCGKGMVKVT